MDNRIILLIDMDCFYVQVEQKLQPEFQNMPAAVVQYKNFKGGGIIAVNYEARAFGVKRGGMHGDDARKLCPQIHLFQVAEVRGKADLTKYRDASATIFEVLKRFASIVERASIDEAYLDVTKEIDQWLGELGPDGPRLNAVDLPSTYVEGFISIERGDESGIRSWLETSFAWDRSTKRLALAALLSERIRAAVLTETGFKCSAGIAPNKMLAKLACGLHKPNKQTLVLPNYIPQLLANVPIFKLRNFGGHLGAEVSSRFQVTTMGELSQIPRDRLIQEFGEKNGARIYDVARGIDPELVVSRQVVKSIGCGKNFRGPDTLTTKTKIKYWLNQMAEELEERLNRDRATNNRSAELLTVGALFSEPADQGGVKHHTRCVRLTTYQAKQMASDAFKALCKLGKPSNQDESNDLWNPPIINLSITASKFNETEQNNNSIKSLFSKQQVKSPEKKLDSRPKTAPQIDLELPTTAEKKGILLNNGTNSAGKKRPSSSVSFHSLAKQIRRSSLTRRSDDASNEGEGDVEISWRDDSRQQEARGYEPEEGEDVFTSPVRRHHDEEDDMPMSQTAVSAGQMRQSRRLNYQKLQFERASQSIKSLIARTLEQVANQQKNIEEQNIQTEYKPVEEAPKSFFAAKIQQQQQNEGDSSSNPGKQKQEDSTKLNSNVAIPSLPGLGGGSSFFKQKQQELLQKQQQIEQNPPADQQFTIDLGDYEDSDGDFVQRLDRPSTSTGPTRPAAKTGTSMPSKQPQKKPVGNSVLTTLKADTSGPSLGGGSGQPYYVSVQAEEVDLELLRQMPAEIQREYATALGLDLKKLNLNSGKGSGPPAVLTTAANRPHGGGLPLGGLPRQTASGAGANKKTATKPKTANNGKNRPGSSNSSTKQGQPVITIDDFFR